MLAQLQMGIHYSAQTFGSNFKPSIDIIFLEMTAGLYIEDTLIIENSFFGVCECVFIALIWKSLPADENHHDLLWVTISNFYLGSGEEELLESSAHRKRGVVGLFRFTTNNGKTFFNFFFLNSIIASPSTYEGRYAGCSKAYCVFIEVLMEVGLKLSSIGEE